MLGLLSPTLYRMSNVCATWIPESDLVYDVLSTIPTTGDLLTFFCSGNIIDWEGTSRCRSVQLDIASPSSQAFILPLTTGSPQYSKSPAGARGQGTSYHE